MTIDDSDECKRRLAQKLNNIEGSLTAVYELYILGVIEDEYLDVVFKRIMDKKRYYKSDRNYDRVNQRDPVFYDHNQD